MVHAPFNFIPVSDRVYCPNWPGLVSQDVPFSDGLSGELQLEITARSPIFVRNGTSKIHQDAKDDDWNAFSNLHGDFFIPGSSIKGALRNTLEILSFGKMFCPPVESNTPCRRIDDRRHSFRDLTQAGKKDYLDKMKPKDIRCGWLRQLENEDGSTSHVILDCGLPARISHSEIDRKLGTNLADFFSNPGNMGNNNSVKTAKFKYDMVGNLNQLTSKFSFEQLPNLEAASFNPNGEEATIVLTGQPAPRDNALKQGKKWEFVFKKHSGTHIEISKTQWLDFLSIYDDHDKSKVSVDWDFWRQKLKTNHNFPVFFRLNEKLNRLEHFGLAYLYKMPSLHSVRNGLSSPHHAETTCDLADCIFGFVAKDRDMLQAKQHDRLSLRGRVHLSHAFALRASPATVKTEILGSPKSSYYPIYLRQVSTQGRMTHPDTYMKEQGKIHLAGWKRYPVRLGESVTHNNPLDNDRVQTSFIPLHPGAKFKLSIRLHNLRHVELGALLSAITFHDTPLCYHSLGMAKPLGYGKCSVAIINSNGFTHDLASPLGRKHYLTAFEAEMNLKLFEGKPIWNQSPQVRELIAIASEPTTTVNDTLSYMTLEQHINEKQAHHMGCLQPYSQLPDAIPAKTPAPLTTDESLANLQLQTKQERVSAENAKRELDIAEAEHRKAKENAERKELADKLKAEQLAKQEQEKAERKKNGFNKLADAKLDSILSLAKKIENDGNLTGLLLEDFKKLVLHKATNAKSNDDVKSMSPGTTKGKGNWRKLRDILGEQDAAFLQAKCKSANNKLT